MANNKSAKKRIKINERNRRQNRYYKTNIRTTTKLLIKIIERYKITENGNDKEEAKKVYSRLNSLLDKATKHKVFHKNSAARQKSRLALYMYSNF